MDSDFVKPRYDAGGFSGLPLRIRDHLTGAGKYDAVILLLIDGFGWRFLEKYQEEAFLKRIERGGRIEKLSSQFPSTTAAAMTTIHTGMPVGKHGIFEWNYFEPELDAIIAPLLFSYAGTPERDTLKQAGVKPQRLFPATTFYQELKRLGVSANIFQHREYTPSTFSNIVFSGATARGYRTLPEALVNLGDLLSKQAPPVYFFLYFEKIDAIGHEYGPESAQVSAEIENLLFVLETAFTRLAAADRKRTLLLLTADHGQVEVDPKTTVYINREPRFAGFEKYLRTDAGGRPLVPAGSCRDFFLYIREGLVAEAQAFFAARLEGQAEVRKVADLAGEGYFGPEISPAFRTHAGDLVILPYRHESIWWYEKDKFEQRYYGHHGGLTRQEIEIPLLSYEL
jgi:hypothetical protein